MSQAPFTIKATVHDDNHAMSADFDAVEWFVASSDDEILALAAVDWANDEPADYVALYFEDRNPEVTAVFAYRRAASSPGNPVGFECSVDGNEAMAWLSTHRPSVWAQALCQEHGVKLAQNGLNLWCWTDTYGVITSNPEDKFYSIAEAATDAVRALTLNV